MLQHYDEIIALLNARDDETRERKLHRLALERYTESDCEFFFTICARQHQRPFLNEAIARKVIEALLWYRAKHQWRLFCYCLMPDHLHFVLQLPDQFRRVINAGARGEILEGVLEQISYFKSYTTNKIWWSYGGQGVLWQKSSYDHAIRYNDSVEESVRYTMNNPVRKGLCETWDEYPNSAIVDEW